MHKQSTQNEKKKKKKTIQLKETDQRRFIVNQNSSLHFI